MLAAAGLLLAAGYQFWLRDSSLVAVERVMVTGLSTSDAERVRVALGSTGRSMTTLNVDHEALERAVAAFPAVRELEVATDFPHGLSIHVVEHVPAALAVGDGGRVPVAGDGTILHGLPVPANLPTIDAEGAIGGDHLRAPTALAAAAIAGGAPAALRGRIAEVGEDGESGQVVELRDGPELIFGDASRVADKWAAAARVLADLEASGASYIDVRIPGRPAVGGLPAETIVPVAPAGATSTTPSATITGETGAITDPTAAGTIPPTGTTTPPAGTTTTDPSTILPSDGTTAPPAPQPTTPAPVTGGTGGGATAAPAP
jgi:cell division protein FtsQ